MADEDIQRYLDRIELQHHVRPRFMAVAKALLEKLDPAHGAAKDIPALYDVRRAEGAQLDALGETVGVRRKDIPSMVPGMTEPPNDELYRTIVLAKIAQNNWDGTNGGFRDIWDATVASIYPVEYTDNQDMTLDVTVNAEVDEATASLLANEMLIPKPAGTAIHTEIHVQNEPGDTRACAGIALYGVDRIDFDSVELPAIDTDGLLYDEEELFLIDENGVALYDEDE